MEDAMNAITCFELSQFPTVVLLGKRICDVNFGYANYRIQDYEFAFVSQGNLHLTINGESFTATEGECVLLKPDDLISARTDPEHLARYYSFHFKLNCPSQTISPSAAYARIRESMKPYDPREIRDVFEMPLTINNTIYLTERCSVATYKNRIFDIIEVLMSERNRLMIGNETMVSIKLCEILILLSRITLEQLGVSIVMHGNTIQRPVQDALDYIHNNYMKPIHMEDMCRLFDISQQYFIRIFKKNLHVTPLRYINMFRVSRAKDLLRYTSLYVKEVANAVGIPNLYYFCRIFKELEHMTPSEYRNQPY
jgi:AraC-like DNA-binding protein